MNTDLYLPLIRCYSCGTVIATLFTRYQQLIAVGVSPENALNQIGAKRYCCRGLILNPPVLPAGSIVDDDIEALQHHLKRLFVEPPKAHGMNAVLPAMKTQVGIGYNNPQTTIQVTEAPKMIRVYSSTIGGIPNPPKERRPMTYEEIVQNLRNVKVPDEQILTMMREKGVTDENARQFSYFVKRGVGHPDFDAVHK